MKSHVTLVIAAWFLLSTIGSESSTVTSRPAGAEHTSNSTTNGASFTSAGTFFALSVGDITASSNWYSEKLGLKAVLNLPKRDKAAVVVLEGGGLIVELIQHDDALPLSKAAPAINDHMFIHGIVKVGIIVDDLDKTLAALKEKNVTIAFGPYPQRADQRANFIIRDNAGNLIQFFGK
jgi:catechol 2,3-dioxygenase-like lactoylglutathione lyase family enzyme